MKLYTKIVYGLSVCSVLLLSSCNNANRSRNLTDISFVTDDYDETPVNAIEQALPTMVIIPSDQLLKTYGALERKIISGKEVYSRDYNKYLLNNSNNKALISLLQDEFVKLNFPLSDLEQTLKAINTQSALDEADDFQKDPKTLLLTKVSPDIILELDYSYKMDMNSRDLTRHLFSYTINAIDAYTNKVFSSQTYENLVGASATEIFKSHLHKNIDKLSQEINNYFANIIYRGREITVRIAVERGSNIKLSDESIEGHTYADWIMDYIKTHAKKGTYTMQRNTDNELYFVNVRINTLNTDGTQFSAYDWGRELSKALRKQLGVKTVNKTQGLGQIIISIKGM